jgi:signal transduction histidine kinase
MVIIFARYNAEKVFVNHVESLLYDKARLLADRVAFSSSKADIQDYISSVREGESRAFLLGSDGAYLAHADINKIDRMAQDDFSPFAIETILTEGDGTYSDPLTQDVFAFSQVPNQDILAVIVSQPTIVSSLMADLDQATIPGIAISVFIISVSSGVVIWVIVGLPLRHLITAFEEVGDGNLQVEVNPKDMVDELEILASNFNHMVSQLQLLVKNLEQSVAERTTELESANKELEAFSYSVSHDLRAPLRGINGFSHMLLEHADKLGEEGTHHLNRIRDATMQMDTLIDGLLMLSRVTQSRLNIQEINMSALVRDIMRELEETEPDRTLNFVVEEDISLRGDRKLLEIVTRNLLSNAWKFTGDRKDAQIEFGTESQDGRKVFYVRDNGVGFDMKYADKLFQPFQRLHSDKEYEGTGIGMATVKRIINRHRGQIWAESVAGEGTTFYFSV